MLFPSRHYVSKNSGLLSSSNSGDNEHKVISGLGHADDLAKSPFVDSSFHETTKLVSDVKELKGTNQQEKYFGTVGIDGDYTQSEVFKDDENKERGNWSGRLDFILSCLGYAVGLGNVWRFPYLCYKNGGGVFFIPYFIFLIFVGMPIFLLELSIGQFTSLGVLNCWENVKLFKGIGLGMFFISTLISIYYNVIIGWSFWYMFASFTSRLPWESCETSGKYKPTRLCWTLYKQMSVKECTDMGGAVISKKGYCSVNNTLYGIINTTIAKKFGLTKRTVAEDYLHQVGFQLKDSSGFSDLGPLRWDMSLAILLAWIVMFFCLFKGIKSSGKVVYFTATFPYVILIILFVRGLLLEGYEKGIYYYLKPDFQRLQDSTVWKDAAAQIFFSLSAGFGGLIVLSSYNKFHNNILRDTFIVCIGNSLTSIFAGFVIFSFIGALSHQLNIPVEDVATGGVSLAFVIYPQAVTYLSVSPLWSILFFLMLITLGLDSQFANVETVITTIVDTLKEWGTIHSKNWKIKIIIVGVVCIIGFFSSLIMCTAGGPYMVTLMDDYVGGWNVILIAFFECICIAWIYGAKQFTVDIGVMISHNYGGCWTSCRWWWIVMWSFTTPVLLLGTLIFSLVKYQGSRYDFYVFPKWANALGWMMTMLIVVSIFIPGVYYIFKTNGSLMQRLKILTKPTKKWGPALPLHRKEVAEANLASNWSDSFITNPPTSKYEADNNAYELNNKHRL